MNISNPEFDAEYLANEISKFSNARILVIGDIILDKYIWGKVSRISPEAPVPVVEVKEETQMLGGAANVAHNLASLGASPILCGVLGNDGNGHELLSMIEDLGLRTDGIVMERGRPTSIKSRVIAHSQQVVRFDRESKAPINEGSLATILEYVEHVAGKLDVVLVSDYGKGVVSSRLMEGLKVLLGAKEVPIAVDPKIGNFACYKGVHVITPNHHEAGAYCRFSIEDQEGLVKAGHMLLEELKCEAVLITQGKKGMTLFEREGLITHIPAVAKEVYDVTGAGDTVIATLCLGMAAGLDLVSSAVIANFAAGIVVGQVGTSAVRADQLQMAIQNHRR
ncbi:MAG: D-glycero-beta-D-manno-heptose-7-phosphate kinase [Deltaproteobacteria bacterium]|nr:D-glycero-beta-D-manno-heptose-7-phosphate kinase [Deltaproteobacteria bacterium]MBW1928767.1 D-glycero-beta-D-manno-heptose-7-phosphate kinase [Deltaproteobacteria bacterium]RLB24433.1 MAG: D-glycero-beta-D-manno-heptose-7-phosphate kinase [Deltaproteobacteria bacterium]